MNPTAKLVRPTPPPPPNEVVLTMTEDDACIVFSLLYSTNYETAREKATAHARSLGRSYDLDRVATEQRISALCRALRKLA